MAISGHIGPHREGCALVFSSTFDTTSNPRGSMRGIEPLSLCG
jgi:hypothetical protein